MRRPDAHGEPADEPADAALPLLNFEHIDDTPAQRLLAHDLEHIAWADDDTFYPPPD
jgi:hypothetical protein